MVNGVRILTIVFMCHVIAPCIFGIGIINKLVYNNNGFGIYSFEYETSDGTYRKEDGGLNSDNNMVVRGEYGYIDAGRLYTVKYIADENGFRPQNNDLIDTRFNDRRIV